MDTGLDQMSQLSWQEITWSDELMIMRQGLILKDPSYLHAQNLLRASRWFRHVFACSFLVG